jgi:hypothetical protein
MGRRAHYGSDAYARWRDGFLADLAERYGEDFADEAAHELEVGGVHRLPGGDAASRALDEICVPAIVFNKRRLRERANGRAREREGC